jgi:hypothetical protein
MFMFIDTSIDNMLAAFGLGALAPNSISRTTVFSTFVTAEAAAAISGELLRNTWLGHSAHLLAPAVVPLYILCAALFLIRGTATSGVSPLGIAGVALLFSLDNFIAAASGQTDFSLLKSVLLPAAISGITALPALEAGRFFSAQLRRVWKDRLVNAQVSRQRS